MERIIRLNAVKNLCLSGIVGMNEHQEHPRKNSAPLKLTISGVNFASPIGVFLNTPNTKCNNLLLSSAVIGNTELFGKFLQALLSKALKVLSDLVLPLCITFATTLATGERTRKIEPVTRFHSKSQLWVVRTFEKIKSEVVQQKQKATGDKKAFYYQIAFSITNLLYQQVDVFYKKTKVQIKLGLNRDCNYEFMGGKIVTTWEDKQTSEKLVEAYQVELLLEGEK